MAKQKEKKQLTEAALDRATQALNALATRTPPKLSRREAVLKLKDKIEALLERGWSYQAVAQTLSGALGPLTGEQLKRWLEAPAPSATNRQMLQHPGELHKPADKPA